MAFGYFRKADPQPTPARPVGATFGPWADHNHTNAGSSCSVCR